MSAFWQFVFWVGLIGMSVLGLVVAVASLLHEDTLRADSKNELMVQWMFLMSVVMAGRTFGNPHTTVGAKDWVTIALVIGILLVMGAAFMLGRKRVRWLLVGALMVFLAVELWWYLYPGLLP